MTGQGAVPGAETPPIRPRVHLDLWIAGHNPLLEEVEGRRTGRPPRLCSRYHWWLSGRRRNGLGPTPWVAVPANSVATASLTARPAQE